MESKVTCTALIFSVKSNLWSNIKIGFTVLFQFITIKKHQNSLLTNSFKHFKEEFVTRLVHIRQRMSQLKLLNFILFYEQLEGWIINMDIV